MLRDFKNTDIIDKPLVRLTKRKREKTQIKKQNSEMKEEII